MVSIQDPPYSPEHLLGGVLFGSGDGSGEGVVGKQGTDWVDLTGIRFTPPLRLLRSAGGR